VIQNELEQTTAPPDFQLNWRKLQQIGLNAYEARSYLVLIGHKRFKALELAARAHVPRQKIYEVLDSLVEKGFAQVVQEKTKLFSAIDPNLAVPGYLERRKRSLEDEIDEQTRLANGLIDDLRRAYDGGQEERGTLDFLHLVNEPSQTAAHYRRMLGAAQTQYVEFMRPPFAVDPLGDQLVREAKARGVVCRLLVEDGQVDDAHRARLRELVAAGIDIRFCEKLPLKLAIFDDRSGLLALLDPVLTNPTWTAVVFDHAGFAEAMVGLFETYWARGREVEPQRLEANAG